MKIKDILKEGYCDLVAHYYPNFDAENYDSVFNPDAEKFAGAQRATYKDLYNENGINIVTTAPADDDKWDITPDTNSQISPGARGNIILSRKFK